MGEQEINKLNIVLASIFILLAWHSFTPESNNSQAAVPCWYEGCAANDCFGWQTPCIALICPDGEYLCWKMEN